MRKKVLLIIPSLNGGGAERVIINIIKKLDLNKFNPKLIVINKVGPYVDELPNNIEIIDLKCDRVRFAIIKLIKEINKFNPESILSTLGYLNLVLIAIRPFIKKRCKIIIREANTPSKYLSNLSSIKKYIMINIYKLLYKRADVIVAQCEDMKKDIIEYFNIKCENIVCIYNPVDVNYIFSKYEDYNPYDTSKINIVAVGKLSYQKGFDTLIKAFNIVWQEDKRFHLTILGDGELKNELIKLSSELGINSNVSFVGFEKNPYIYYRYADTYVLSSRWEGFPNSLLEAVTCGAKVISTDCKSGPREILENNKYGILVPVDDYKMLADKIIEYNKMDNRSNNRYKIYDSINIVKKYEKIFL